MKKKHITPLLLVLFGLALFSGCSSQAKLSKGGVTLRLKPQQGKTYTIITKSNTMNTMEVQGQSMSMSQSMETTQSFTAKEVTNNESTFETQIDAIKMTISQMGMKLEYDSEHPEKTSPMLAGQTKEIEENLHKSESIKYDIQGHIVDSIDITKSQLDQVINLLPEGNVSVGTLWVFDKTQNISGNEITSQNFYHVTAISEKSVDVRVSGHYEDAAKKEIGTFEGTASIDPKTGIVMNSNIKSNLSMTINEQGMSIPMTIVGNTTVDVK